MKILDRERSKDKLKVGFGQRISEMNSNKYDLQSDDDKSIQSPAIIKQRERSPSYDSKKSEIREQQALIKKRARD